MIEKHDKYYIDLALQISNGSKCQRAKYGSLILADDKKRIVSTGFNGKPSKSCCDNICFREGLPSNHVSDMCCLHSEFNALIFSEPLERRNATIYISGVPCRNCALMIMNSGIKRVVYLDKATESGHTGDSNREYWSKYGLGIELVPFTYEEYKAIWK